MRELGLDGRREMCHGRRILQGVGREGVRLFWLAPVECLNHRLCGSFTRIDAVVLTSACCVCFLAHLPQCWSSRLSALCT